jgi:hypothetical protein
MESRIISFHIAIYGGSVSSRDDLLSLIIKGKKPESYYIEFAGVEFQLKEFNVTLDRQPYRMKGVFWRMDQTTSHRSLMCDYNISLTGKHAVFLAADSQDKLEDVNKVLEEEVKRHNHSDLPVYLVVNNTEVTSDQADEFKTFAEKEKIVYLEYSSAGSVVKEVLEKSAEKYLRDNPYLIKPLVSVSGVFAKEPEKAVDLSQHKPSSSCRIL